MSAVVSAVNSLGSAVFGGLSTFLTLNYVVGGAIAHFVLSVASSIGSLIVAAAKAVEVMLEDLLVFFRYSIVVSHSLSLNLDYMYTV